MSLPEKYLQELNILNKEILNNKPSDVLQFCANYFNRRLAEERSVWFKQCKDLDAKALDPAFQAFSAKSFASKRPNPSQAGEASPRCRTPQDEDHGAPPTASSTTNTIDQSMASRSPVSPTPMRGEGLFRSSFTGGAEPGPSAVTTASTAQTRKIAADHAPDHISNQMRFNANRRVSVSAESLDPDAFKNASSFQKNTGPIHPELMKRLNQSVSKNFLFSNLDEDSLHLLLYALQEKRVPKGTVIIKQGDEGDFYYIVESGAVEFLRDNQLISNGGPGTSFGELALMYNAPRAATVRAIEDCTLWALDRLTFKKILLDKTTKKRNMYGNFLKEVPVLKVLGTYELTKLADALKTKSYEPGEIVVREGDPGDDFFLIESGTADVKKEKEGVVKTLQKGDYFGEVAILHDLPRQATVVATSKLRVACLGRQGFERLLGPVIETLRRQDPTHGH